MSRLRTTKSSSTNIEIIVLTSPPSSPDPSNQQMTMYHINTDMQSKRKFDQLLHDTSQRCGSKGLLEKNQGVNSKNNSTLHHRRLPSTPPAIPIVNTQINSHNVVTLGLLEKNQGVNSKNDSILHHRRLPSPPPAIPIVNTQTNSGTVAALRFLEKNQGVNNKNNSTLHHRRLPSPPPAIPIVNTQINSRNDVTLGMSEIQQGSNTINYLVKVPKRSSPLPSTSRALSRLRTTKSSSTNIEIIDLTSPPSSPGLSNKQVTVYHINTDMQSKRKFDQLLHDTSQRIGSKGLSEIQPGSNTINNIAKVPKLSSPSPSTSSALSRLRTRKSSSINSEMIELMSSSTPTPNNQSSPTLSTQSKIVYYPLEFNNEFEERLFGTSRNNAYKIYETIFYGKKLRCINREPNSYKNFMVNLEYLVRVHFPMCSVERCARILTSRFKIAVVPANNDQLALLFIQKKNVIESPATKMIVSLKILNYVFIQLKSLINMNQ